MDLGVEGGMYFYLVLFVYQVQGREVRLWTHFTAETKPRFCFRSVCGRPAMRLGRPAT